MGGEASSEGALPQRCMFARVAQLHIRALDWRWRYPQIMRIWCACFRKPATWGLFVKPKFLKGISPRRNKYASGVHTHTKNSNCLQDLVRRRVALQQQAHQIYEQKERERKVRKVRIVHEHVTEEEAARALVASSNNEVCNIRYAAHYVLIRFCRILPSIDCMISSFYCVSASTSRRNFPLKILIAKRKRVPTTKRTKTSWYEFCL